MHSSFWCIRCGAQWAVDALLNVLLFIPFGIGMGLLRVRPARALATGVALSSLIEALQFFVIVGRYSNFRDIVTNSLGAAIGYLLGRYWRVLFMPDRRNAIRLVLTSATMWIAVQAFTAWALGISPPLPPWWVQFKPEHQRFSGYFVGKLLSLSIGSMTVNGSDSLADADKARQALLVGEPFEVRTTRVQPSHGIAAIAIVSAGPEYDVAMWALHERHAIFMVTVRGTRLGLRTPSVRLENIIPQSPADTLLLSGRYFEGRYELRAESNGVRRVRELAASPSLTWAFFLHIPLYAFGREVMLLTAIWLASIWLILGYWSGRAMVPSNSIIPIELGVAVIIGLGVVPMFFGLPVAHWSEWLATIAAASVGWLIARRMVRVKRSAFTGDDKVASAAVQG